jgi:hypothetical protein
MAVSPRHVQRHQASLLQRAACRRFDPQADKGRVKTRSLHRQEQGQSGALEGPLLSHQLVMLMAPKARPGGKLMRSLPISRDAQAAMLESESKRPTYIHQPYSSLSAGT